MRDGRPAATLLIVANDEARALLARGKKQARSFRQALKQAGVRAEDFTRPVDLVAVRASIRRARVEDEVEKRVAARTGADRLLRIAEVKKLTGLGRTTIWQLGRDGLFPKRVKLSGARGRAVGWRESEVRRWIAERTTKGMA